MRIDGSCTDSLQVARPGKQQPVEVVADKALRGSSSDASIEKPSADEMAEGMEKACGVLRLLQAGHFKGVADLRLRINFSEELAELEAAQRQAVTGDMAGSVLTSVGLVVDAFLAENDLAEEDAAVVLQAQEDFTQAAGSPQTITEAFESFVAALRGLFEVSPGSETLEIPPVEQGSEDTENIEEMPESEDPAEPILPTEPSPDWQGLIQNMQEAFAAAMDKLNSALSDVSVLPPLSGPSGNGAAYAKFLAIYNQMHGIADDIAGLDVTEPAEPA